jgi:arylsulfatase A-like enzyme
MSIGKWHLGGHGTPSGDPAANGFDYHLGNELGYVSYFADRNGNFNVEGLGSHEPGDYLTDKLTAQARWFIAVSRALNRPFFLYMSHYAPHVPLEAPADLVEKYSAKPATPEHSNPTYAAMLEKLDDSLGKILDTLTTDRYDIRDNTIIIFMSDNGGSPIATTNTSLRGGKGRLYEGGTRVPMVVSWTGNEAITRDSVSTSPVITHDIYPTLLDLADLEIDPIYEPSLDGVSIRSALEGAEDDYGAILWH